MPAKGFTPRKEHRDFDIVKGGILCILPSARWAAFLRPASNVKKSTYEFVGLSFIAFGVNPVLCVDDLLDDLLQYRGNANGYHTCSVAHRHRVFGLEDGHVYQTKERVAFRECEYHSDTSMLAEWWDMAGLLKTKAAQKRVRFLKMRGRAWSIQEQITSKAHLNKFLIKTTLV